MFDLTELLANTEWMEQAACQDMDVNVFYPVSEVGLGMRDVLAAKAVCASCPVRQACLDYAYEQHLTDGIFGGLTPEERYPRTRART